MGDFNNIINLDEKLGGDRNTHNHTVNFINFLNSINVVSIPSEGIPFTWTNKHKDNTVIYEKLDRAVANPTSLNLYPNMSLENLPIVGSNHGPIAITLSQKVNSGTKPFRFEAMWFSHDSLINIVKNAWSNRTDDNPIQNFSGICNVFASLARNWNREVFGNLFSKMNNLQKDIIDVQAQLMINPLSNYLRKREGKLLHDLMDLYQNEELFWAQKARANWLSLGDRNTLQTQAIIRKKRNFIGKIKDDHDIWHYETNNIISVFLQEFKKWFSVDTTPSHDSMNSFLNIISPCISDVDNRHLTNQVTLEEIHHALFSIGRLKAPGPDGLHALFFQKYWEIVKGSIFNFVDDFFKNCTSLSTLNHTNIALIPKINNPDTIGNFRAISLCNVAYKINSKIIVSRLRPLLKKCMFVNQGAFAPDVSIMDNILIAHEIFSDFKKKKGKIGTMALKLDLEKAFDMLNWHFISACLTKFGFDHHWISLIIECVSSVSFSLILNGKLKGFFFPSRGIRQVDHLSPYIFIFCMEPLIRYLNEASKCSKNHVAILSSPQELRVSNLMFIDGCLIFGKA